MGAYLGVGACPGHYGSVRRSMHANNYANIHGRRGRMTMAILGHINLLIIDFSTFEQIIIKAPGMLIISEFFY